MTRQITYTIDIDGKQRILATLGDMTKLSRELSKELSSVPIGGARFQYIQKMQAGLQNLKVSAHQTGDALKSVTGTTNQAGIAMQNMNFVVRDSPYFFKDLQLGVLAVGNNINPLIDSFIRLKKEAKEQTIANGKLTTSFGLLKKSMMGGMGLSLLFSVLVTAFQAVVFSMKSTKAEAKKVEDRFKTLKVSIDDLTASLQQLAEFRMLQLKIDSKEFAKASGELDAFVEKWSGDRMSIIQHQFESFFDAKWLRGAPDTLDEWVSAISDVEVELMEGAKTGNIYAKGLLTVFKEYRKLNKEMEKHRKLAEFGTENFIKQRDNLLGLVDAAKQGEHAIGSWALKQKLATADVDKLAGMLKYLTNNIYVVGETLRDGLDPKMAKFVTDLKLTKEEIEALRLAIKAFLKTAKNDTDLLDDLIQSDRELKKILSEIDEVQKRGNLSRREKLDLMDKEIKLLDILNGKWGRGFEAERDQERQERRARQRQREDDGRSIVPETAAGQLGSADVLDAADNYDELAEKIKAAKDNTKILTTVSNQLGQALVNVFMLGKFELDNFVKAVMAAIAQMLILKWITNMLFGLATGGAATALLTVATPFIPKGDITDGGIQPPSLPQGSQLPNLPNGSQLPNLPNGSQLTPPTDNQTQTVIVQGKITTERNQFVAEINNATDYYNNNKRFMKIGR